MNLLKSTLFLTGLLLTTLKGEEIIRLSLDDAIELAYTNSRSLQISQLKSVSAQAKASESGTYLLPVLRFSASAITLSEENPFTVNLPLSASLPSQITLGESITKSYAYRLTVQQPLFTGLKLINHRKIARYQSESAQLELTRKKQELKYQIGATYWNLYQALQIENLINETILQLKSHLTDIENFCHQGMATQNEVLKVKTQLSQLIIQQIEASNAIRMAMNCLNSLMGIPLSSEIELTSQIISQKMPANQIEELIEHALKNRPELKSLQYGIKAGQSGVRIAQSGWWPQIALIGNYTYANPNSRIIPLRDRYDDTWDVGLYVTMDIWNWGLPHYQTIQAKAQLEQIQAGYQQMIDAITLEVTQDYLNFGKSQQIIKAAELGVEHAEENFRITQEKFKNGWVINSELLDAESLQLLAKTNLTQSIVENEIARIRLCNSSGLNW